MRTFIIQLVWLLFSASPVLAADVLNGKAIFNGSAGCKTCHKITDEKMVGPGLAGNAALHSEAWLYAMLKNPEGIWRVNDDETLAMKKRAGRAKEPRPAMRMRRELSDEEIADLIAYLKTL